MAESIDDATKEKLKSALWFSIGKIADEESARLNTTATPQFIGTLTEMVWTQIENIALDLETFAHHANRSTIQADDVLLITRRNEVLEEIMREFIDGRRAAAAAEEDDGGTRAKKSTSKSKSANAGVSKGGKVARGSVEKGNGKGKGRKGSV